MTLEACAVIVLASGLSQRFGPQNKLLANLGGQPVLSHVFEFLENVNFGARYAVTAASDVRALARAAGYLSVHNDNQMRGHSYARSLGARQALDDGFEAAIIVLGDMPFVGAAHIQDILDNAAGHDVVMSRSAGIVMPPAFFSGAALRGLAANIARAKPDALNAPHHICELSAIQARDIDTADDLNGG
mgnify:CR=1 FL=1